MNPCQSLRRAIIKDASFQRLNSPSLYRATSRTKSGLSDLQCLTKTSYKEKRLKIFKLFFENSSLVASIWIITCTDINYIAQLSKLSHNYQIKTCGYKQHMDCITSHCNTLTKHPNNLAKITNVNSDSQIHIDIKSSFLEDNSTTIYSINDETKGLKHDYFMAPGFKQCFQ